MLPNNPSKGLLLTTILPPIIPVSATREPTERSMLPATITKVMPKPTVIVMALCCRISVRFCKVAKRDGINAMKTPRTMMSERNGTTSLNRVACKLRGMCGALSTLFMS